MILAHATCLMVLCAADLTPFLDTQKVSITTLKIQLAAHPPNSTTFSRKQSAWPTTIGEESFYNLMIQEQVKSE